MELRTYTTSNSKIALTVPLVTAPPPRKLKHSKGLRFIAFTLAETLITLAIIGLVASMTIPTLISKYQKHTYVVALKKAYAELSNAVQIAPILANCPAGDYDCADFFNFDKQIELLSKSLKLVKVYNVGDTYPVEFENHPALGYGGWASLFTADGMMFSSLGLTVHVDVNGLRGPNEFCQDIFSFYISSDENNGVQQGRVIPYGSELMKKYLENHPNPPYNPGLYAYGTCTAQILEEGAMNY